MALTTSAIDTLEPRKTRYSVPDGNGLVLRIFPSGTKSWVVRISFEVSEACLAHVVGDRFARTYQRSDFLDARRPIMEAWCAYILTSIEMGRIKLMGASQKE